MADQSSPKPPVEIIPSQADGISALASANAPFVYFEAASAFGHFAGLIRVTLEAQRLIPTNEGRVSVDRVIVGHLRMSIPAARSLKAALDGALLLASSVATEAKN